MLIPSCVPTALSLALFLFVPQATQAPNVAEALCRVDLAKPGMMADIVSNALMRGFERPEDKVQEFLAGAKQRYATGTELLEASAAHFEISADALRKSVDEYEHCNCEHPAKFTRVSDSRRESAVTISQFAQDVTTHVILHELAHALIREFDLPVLGNEETQADAFATYYLTTYLPDRAPDVLLARVRSWMVEASEVPRDPWPVRGEHASDARRAFQVAALAVAANPDAYAAVAAAAGMSSKDISRSRDYGSEVLRSWRRVLHPLWMPAGTRSTEVRIAIDDQSPTLAQLQAPAFTDDLTAALQSFDWHSQVTLRLVDGDGGAGWNRSKRTIRVHSEYILRFVKQGKSLSPSAD